MSKSSMKSKSFTTGLGSQRKRRYEGKNKNVKPFGFCCSIDDFDPLTQYDKQNSLYKTSAVSINAINECPVLKFRARFSDYIDSEQKKKNSKTKHINIGDHKHKLNAKHRRTLNNSQSVNKFHKQPNSHKGYNPRNPHKQYNWQNPNNQYGPRNPNKQYNSSNPNKTYLEDPQNFEDLHDERVSRFLSKPLQWYLEDEVGAGKDILWEQKQTTYNKEMDKNTVIGRNKVKSELKTHANLFCPHWYQDFSIHQVKNLMMLQCVMHKDCEEMVTGRTQRTLTAIGIVSTFFMLKPDIIRNLQEYSNCNVIEFLREIYKVLTGNYFEEEGYKELYDCNERIILTAIAFLTLPEAIVELHKRLPPAAMPKLPAKPVPPMVPVRQKMLSPYTEELFVHPDWVSYYNHLQRWREQCKLIPKPKLVLPPTNCILTEYKKMDDNFDGEENRHIEDNPTQVEQEYNTFIKDERKKSKSLEQNYNAPVDIEEKTFTTTADNNPARKKQKDNVSTIGKQQDNVSSKEKQKDNVSMKEKQNKDVSTKEKRKDNVPVKRKHSRGERTQEFKQDTKEEYVTDNIINNEQTVANDSEKPLALALPQVPDENKLFDFTINGISEKPGPVEYKICGVLQPPQPNKKSWLGEKHAHYIISGAPDEPPTCPVTYEMTGVANVTPTNSNERFFAVLKLGDGPKSIYPSGRKNLSRNWQDWLQNTDEEFRKVEREANKMIKSIEAITRLVFPDPTCDSCCSCRQTRKSYFKAKETKTPYFVIDTITEDNKKNKYIVGSMSMHSPAPTPPESTVNLLEVIASEDVLKSNVVINGVTNETGETQYFITGLKDDIIRVPPRIVERPPPRPPRNVPPCECAVQQIYTKGLTSKISHDNIPWTKDEGFCFGKKFRPNEYPAYSCKKYPGDKSCRRNPFIRDIMKIKRRMEREKQKKEQALSPYDKKKMYSIADFKPCGDEHLDSICGGPWGALHTLTPEELAAQEKLRKEILRGPPCGTKPRRAVCEGPFGARIPEKRQQIEIEEEMPGEGDEDFDYDEDLEEEEEEEKPEVVEEKKEKKRHQKCYMSPDSIAGRKKVEKKEVEKFIPDPNYPGYDDSWNIHRTAPTEKASETDFKALLKLSSPEPPTVKPKSLVDDGAEQVEGPPLEKDVSKSVTLKSTSKIPPKDSKKQATVKSKSVEKALPKRQKSIDRKGVQEIVQHDRKRQEPSEEKITSEVEDKRLAPKPSKTKSKMDDKGEDRKHVKPSRSKGSQKRISGQTSLTGFKKDNKVYQKGGVSKQSDENLTSKSKSGKTDTVHTKVKERSSSRTKQDRKMRSSKSKSSVTRIGRKTSTHRRPSSKRSKEKLNNLMNIETNDRSREKARVKKLNQQQSSARSTKTKRTSRPGNLKGRSARRDKEKNVQTSQDVKADIPPKKLREMMMSSELYPHDVQPAKLPEEPPAKCQLGYEEKEDVADSVPTDDNAAAQLPSRGPCGWRTKSEQELPTKKTLVYLTEPDYPQEVIPVRPGGKSCVCRENRGKKKILMYTIGGLIGGKKDDAEAVIQKKLLREKKDEDDKMQVIDGVFYYTPPPSPRRSEEYVPEYDLYESPYDMCLTKRKNTNLKILEQYSGPKGLIEKTLKFKEPCGCNEYIDTYGIKTLNEDDEKKEAMKELDKARQELIETKSQKDRWKLALKDVGLIDYYARCRDALPCWLKCAKFDRHGCPLRYRKLQVKRPVCECKYERKILENKEEKVKWKERRQRLKSLKKHPFINVDNISKPVVTDTKLMISGVKRIPHEDEYIDDVKYCITGVAENYTQLPSKQIVGGVQMSTPIQTPEPSVEELPCVCLHRHWSPLHIPPGPLVKPEEIRLAQEKCRKAAAKREYEQIYAPQEVYDTHTHSCKEPCGSNSDEKDDESLVKVEKESTQEGNKKVTSYTQKTKPDDRSKKKPSISSKQTKETKLRIDDYKTKMDPKTVTMQKTSEPTKGSSHDIRNITTQKAPESKVSSKVTKYMENKNITNEERNMYSRKPEYKDTEKDTRAQNVPIESSTKDVQNTDEEANEISEVADTNLMTLARQELKKMASEGFLFAKLPKCFLMPQLQYWLMYKEGIALSSADKSDSVRRSLMMWDIIDVRSSKVEPPSISMTKLQLRNLTFDDSERMREKIAKKKALFHSKVRKARVLYARSMWNTMEYGKFPSTSFKRAYFTYVANREADGHVFKPWLPSEVRQMN